MPRPRLRRKAAEETQTPDPGHRLPWREPLFQAAQKQALQLEKCEKESARLAIELAELRMRFTEREELWRLRQLDWQNERERLRKQLRKRL